MADDAPDAGKPPAQQRGDRAGAVRRRRAAYLLLAAPFVALLAVPLYAREEPSLLGWPFFYWYQFAWGLISIALMAIVYRLTRPDPRACAGESPEPDDRAG